MDEINKNSFYWYVVENISNNQKVLDVGCATGYLGSYLKKFLDVEVVGIDYKEFYIKKSC